MAFVALLVIVIPLRACTCCFYSEGIQWSCCWVPSNLIIVQFNPFIVYLTLLLL